MRSWSTDYEYGVVAQLVLESGELESWSLGEVLKVG